MTTLKWPAHGVSIKFDPRPGPRAWINMFLFANVPEWIKEIPGHLKTQEICDETVLMEPYSLEFVPGRLKTQEMCNEAMCREPNTLKFVPGHLKTEEMCNEVMRNNPAAFRRIPGPFKKQEMCIKAVEVGPWQLEDVPDHLKTQEMCDKVVRDDAFSLVCVPDWFVSQEQVKLWHNNGDYCDDDEIIKWYEGNRKRKSQKAKIKGELIPIAWHPDCVMDWCMSEDEKRWWK